MHDNKQEDDNKQAWLGTFFCISNICGVGLNRVGRDRETKEEHDKDCLRGFSVFQGKINRDGEGGREDTEMECCNINI